MKNISAKEHMRRALALAKKAEGRTSPNPMVGAVIVKNGLTLSEGYHKKAGLPHAEIEALKKAGNEARGADLYVNLEPCCHQGRTGPCVEAIIKSGIRRVFVGMRDPNPLVYGKGIRALKKSAIQVTTGILRAECRQLNEIFIKFTGSGKPFVILKSAISLDGKIAASSGESKWISGSRSRQLTHQVRDRVDAIMVGAGTVLKDDPLLTARLKNRKGENPIRVILDNGCRIPLSRKVFSNAAADRVIYVASEKISAARKKQLRRMGVELCVMKEKRGGVNLPQLMKYLGDRDITSVLLEGGSELSASALREKIVDKIMFFVAPIIIGGKQSPSVVAGLGAARLKDAWKIHNLTAKQIGKDFLLEGYL